MDGELARTLISTPPTDAPSAGLSWSFTPSAVDVQLLAVLGVREFGQAELALLFRLDLAPLCTLIERLLENGLITYQPSSEQILYRLTALGRYLLRSVSAGGGNPSPVRISEIPPPVEVTAPSPAIDEQAIPTKPGLIDRCDLLGFCRDLNRVSHPLRFRFLLSLRDEETSSGTLSKQFGTSIPEVASAAEILIDGGLLAQRRQARAQLYSLTGQGWALREKLRILLRELSPSEQRFEIDRRDWSELALKDRARLTRAAKILKLLTEPTRLQLWWIIGYDESISLEQLERTIEANRCSARTCLEHPVRSGFMEVTRRRRELFYKLTPPGISVHRALNEWFMPRDSSMPIADSAPPTLKLVY